MRKRTIVIFSLFWMLMIVVFATATITTNLLSSQSAPPMEGETPRPAAEEPADDSRYARLDAVRKTLMEDYYQDLDEDALLLGAVRGMLEAVDDPYTFYYTPEEMLEVSERSKSSYEGVGVILSSDKSGKLRVLRVFADSPAASAGMLPGDIVTSINGVAINAGTGKGFADALALLRNGDHDLVMLTIERADASMQIGMLRDTIRMERVACAMLDDEVGYLAIYEFMGDEVTGFQNAVKELQAAGAKAVVIDLRSNPGGLLSDVVEIADQLMPEGMIVYTQDRAGRRKEYRSDAACWDVPIAVLVNDMSASASEILAGAIQDSQRGLIIGEVTYGKGVVQTVITFEEDAAGMQLTTARYYTPSGRCIQGEGITPDILVKDDAQRSTGRPDMRNDRQLERAYQALLPQLGRPGV